MNPYESGAVINEFDTAKRARSHHELIAEILDSTIAKTEREHAAARTIVGLHAILRSIVEHHDQQAALCAGVGDADVREYHITRRNIVLSAILEDRP